MAFCRSSFQRSHGVAAFLCANRGDRSVPPDRAVVAVTASDDRQTFRSLQWLRLWTNHQSDSAVCSFHPGESLRGGHQPTCTQSERAARAPAGSVAGRQWWRDRTASNRRSPFRPHSRKSDRATSDVAGSTIGHVSRWRDPVRGCEPPLNSLHAWQASQRFPSTV